jgi:choline kinase
MNDKELKILEILNKKSNISQRDIAAFADISIGKANALIKHFLDENYIRTEKLSGKQHYIVNDKALAILEKNIKRTVENKIVISRQSQKKVTCAVILAAGECSAFDNPVGFLQLGSETVIERIIKQLYACGIEKIIIVTGYQSHYYVKLAEEENVNIVENYEYKSSGTMTSLALAKELIDDDFLLIEGDLVFEKRCITKALDDENRDCIIITNQSDSGDEVFVEIRNGFIYKMSKDKHQFNKIDGEMIGISKISIDIYKKMLEEFKHNVNPYLNYEYMLFDIARTYNIGYSKIEDLIWTEIDTKWHYKNLIKYIYPMLIIKES